jgi:hypothetical protein
MFTRTRTHAHTHTNTNTHNHTITTQSRPPRRPPLITSLDLFTAHPRNQPPIRYLRIIPKTRVLVFNGDLDPCVPYNGNEEWTRGLGLDQTEGWKPWFSDPGTGSQIAGYKTVYVPQHCTHTHTHTHTKFTCGTRCSCRQIQTTRAFALLTQISLRSHLHASHCTQHHPLTLILAFTNACDTILSGTRTILLSRPSRELATWFLSELCISSLNYVDLKVF